MKASIQKARFGRLPNGKSVDLYTLTNSHGSIAKIANYGTIITELHVADRSGKLGDVVLGFDTLDAYLKGSPYFGCTCGRVANRIAKGRFTLDGKTFVLAVNNGPNHLHGGVKGLDKVLWKATPQKGASVKFSYTSPAGEEGYPGKLSATVTMTLTDNNELRIDYTAKANKPTPVNLTNHSYFNLSGNGDVLAHELMIDANFFTPPDDTSIPTGEILKVQGTPMDFTSPKPIGSRLAQLKNDPKGYDHNYVLASGGGQLALAARVRDPKSGRVMEVHTTEPGVQLYSGNYLDGALTGKGGVAYKRHAGFCLETQHYPDSVNRPHFPSVILRPGQTYKTTTVHRFTTA